MKSDTSSPGGGSVKDFPALCLKPDNPAYPAHFADLFRKLPTLYYRGALSLLRSPRMLAVVGSRATSDTNLRSLTTVLGSIRNRTITIISGLALGMDAAAHTIALENGLPTIAVLGSPVDDARIYPRSNVPLAHRILHNNGLILSPFPPGSPIRNYNFPERNQIIAALSQAVLVASAAAKSGALITARLAADYGKEVLAIPGPIYDPLYQGCNELLRSGAMPATSGSDILDFFGLDENPRSTNSLPTDPLQLQLLTELGAERLSKDTLCQRLHKHPSEVNRLISELEIQGLICSSADGFIYLA